METPQMQYEYVDLSNKFMDIAYTYAKRLYLEHGWNKKTIPVCLIIKDGTFIAKGICSDGGHAKEGKCDRLSESGLPYDTCKHCAIDQHAEIKALQSAGDQDLHGAEIYLYGHYKSCPDCIQALSDRGIHKCYLLENSEVLFNRHDKRSVLGTSEQFSK